MIIRPATALCGSTDDDKENWTDCNVIVKNTSTNSIENIKCENILVSYNLLIICMNFPIV